MRRLPLPLLFALTMIACLAPAAQAGITASKVGSVLTVGSNDSGNVNESYTLRDEGANVYVKVTPASPATLFDPDGGGTNCGVSGAGDEVYCARSGITSVEIAAGIGVDTIADNRSQGESVLEGGAGNDQITTNPGSAAAALGEGGEDKITSGGADELSGGAEADTLIAVGNKAFGDSDSGGPGNDIFIGNPDRADRLPAESGGDTYSLGTHVPAAGESGDPATLQLDQYPDAVSYDTIASPVTVSLDGVPGDGRVGEGDNVGADVEVVTGGEAVDLLQAGPNAAGLSGSEGADQLLGGPGPDRLLGGGGNDTLRGGGGDDELDDGDFTASVIEGPQPLAGNDVLDGGGGDDFLLSDRGADDLSGGPGVDRTSFNRPIPQAPSVPTPVAPAGFTISLDDLANDGQTGAAEGDDVHSDIEIVESSDGNDVISGSGAANEIDTGAGVDVVDPGAGPDIVDLGPGDDHVAAIDETVDLIRCRAGSDTAAVDLAGARGRPGDALSDCEVVTGRPIPELAVTPPSGGGTKPPADTARPVVTVSGKAIRPGAFLGNGHIDLTITCNEACSATGKAYRSPARRSREAPIATAKLKLGSGKRTLRLTVPAKAREQFRSKLRTEAQRQSGIKLRVVLTVTGGSGNVTETSRTVAVKG